MSSGEVGIVGIRWARFLEAIWSGEEAGPVVTAHK